ncbi:MAG TPA: hypothetical protein VK524_03135, partial [Polyangiaceae bacterium]|nr:hypothetical protein [Polyangiaceae bacterium]
GPPTVENLVLLCASHNAHSARKVFGKAHIEKKRRDRAQRSVPAQVRPHPQPAEREQVEAKVSLSLCKMGFRKREAFPVLAELRARQVAPEPEPLLRASLALLVP